MPDGTGNVTFGAMREAFATAGSKAPEQKSADLLKECWDTVSAEIDDPQKRYGATLRLFRERLGEMPGELAIAVVEDGLFNERLKRFAHAHHDKIYRQMVRDRRVRAEKARIEKQGGYKQTPAAVRNREWIWKNKGVVSALTVPDNPDLPRTRRSLLESARASKERKKTGATLVKVEVNPREGTVRLVSQLPESIRAFAGWKKAQALEWCDKQEAYAKANLGKIAQVRLWCSAVHDDRMSLGEQLTEDIVKALAAKAT